MSKFKCYLAGRMSNLTYEQMNGWRLEAKRLLYYYADGAIHTENPCDYYNFELDPTTFSDSECKSFDLWLVKNCDVVLVNLDFPDSIGTAIELHMAQEWKIPVIGFGTAKNHPWIELSLTKKCDTMQEAVEHIINFYLPNK